MFFHSFLTRRSSDLHAVFRAFSAQPVGAKDAEKAAGQVPTSSFSGAYLAGRAAEFEDDLKSAVTYYERALALDPQNIDLQQTLLLALVSLGEFDRALPYAEQLKEVPEVERFSRLTLAIEAFRQKDFAAAERWLHLVLESDLDRLIT